MKGPKVGFLFPLQFLIPNIVSLACTTIANNYKVYHRKLGHPHYVVLTHLMKHEFLAIKILFLLLYLLIELRVILVKVKLYIFLCMVVILLTSLRLCIQTFEV